MDSSLNKHNCCAAVCMYELDFEIYVFSRAPFLWCEKTSRSQLLLHWHTATHLQYVLDLSLLRDVLAPVLHQARGQLETRLNVKSIWGFERY